MIMTRILSLLLVSLILTACATSRSISPIVFQGTGYNHARYQADLTDCFRMIDEQSSGVHTADTVSRKATTGAILGTVAGAILGGVVGSPGRGATLGAAIGGATGGVSGYTGSEREKRQVYDQAVRSCLMLKGYQVLGAMGGIQ
jgi:uncharacterized protein YcfJ